MDEKDPSKSGGVPPSFPLNQQSDLNQKQHTADMQHQQNVHAFSPPPPAYTGFVGLEVNNLNYPYNPHPQTYFVQQVQGQSYPIIHHAVSPGNHQVFHEPPPPYMNQQQELFNQQPPQRIVVVKGVSQRSSCSWRKVMVGIFFTLLGLKLILVGIRNYSE
ncbi:hypothetical protein GE061_002216 [Apolygus lucorum]|uniref:Uncharacterized protein n=1 Tax=Apolygus lucorum TaxID=248454 RepID=A0A6A4JEQ6_APOLU|nr:hypothetical protein GE061_002216 [Apolygus lucorum]